MQKHCYNVKPLVFFVWRKKQPPQIKVAFIWNHAGRHASCPMVSQSQEQHEKVKTKSLPWGIPSINEDFACGMRGEGRYVTNFSVSGSTQHMTRIRHENRLYVVTMLTIQFVKLYFYPCLATLELHVILKSVWDQHLLYVEKVTFQK